MFSVGGATLGESCPRTGDVASTRTRRSTRAPAGRFVGSATRSTLPGIRQSGRGALSVGSSTRTSARACGASSMAGRATRRSRVFPTASQRSSARATSSSAPGPASNWPGQRTTSSTHCKASTSVSGDPDVGGDAMRHAADLVVVGYLTYRAGTGQIARAALRTLEAADIHPAIDRVYAPEDDDRYLSALLRRANPLASMKASVLCVVNADQWRYHVRDARRINPATQHVEAVWAWELEEIPSQMFDVAAPVRSRVHALSRWSARAMAKALPVPVQRFAPYNIDVSSGRGRYRNWPRRAGPIALRADHVRRQEQPCAQEPGRGPQAVAAGRRRPSRTLARVQEHRPARPGLVDSAGPPG